MRQDIDHILLTEEEILKRVRELSDIISREYKDLDPVLVCTLKGAVIFYADLIRNIDTHISVDFIGASSYGRSTESSGELLIYKDLALDIAGRHVIVVEDIMDSGFTLSRLCANLRGRGCASLKICTLLDKPERRAPGITLKADYVGFTIPNEFVVGYGLDYGERYRNLPFVGVLKKEVYA